MSSRLRTWTPRRVSGAAVLWLVAGCAGVGAGSHPPSAVRGSTESSVSGHLLTAPGTAGGPGPPATIAAPPIQQCEAQSGFTASLAKEAHGAPTPATALAAFLARPYEPGYTAPVDQWHVMTRTVHAVSYSAGAAGLSVMELADKSWMVVSGETCGWKVALPTALPATTSFRYLDDGVHVMLPAIRRRAAVLLTAQDARYRSTGPTPVPPSYQDPQQSAVIESASIVGGGLQVSFNGDGGTEFNTCGASYYPTTAESSSAVVIYLVKVLGPSPKGTNTACDAVGTQRTAVVALHGPLADRQVIDLITGGVVLRT